MAWKGLARGQAFSISSKTRMLHKACGSQVQRRRWFFIECVTDLRKLLLKGVVDARTLFVLNKNRRKTWKTTYLWKNPASLRKLSKIIVDRGHTEKEVSYLLILYFLFPHFEPLSESGYWTFDLTQYRCSCETGISVGCPRGEVCSSLS